MVNPGFHSISLVLTLGGDDRKEALEVRASLQPDATHACQALEVLGYSISIAEGTAPHLPVMSMHLVRCPVCW